MKAQEVWAIESIFFNRKEIQEIKGLYFFVAQYCIGCAPPLQLIGCTTRTRYLVKRRGEKERNKERERKHESKRRVNIPL
jgi:hypothetical protein